MEQTPKARQVCSLKPVASSCKCVSSHLSVLSVLLCSSCVTFHRCACHIVPIETEDKVTFIPTVHDLDRAWKAAPARERAKWRLLVLTNPGNPTAVVWPRAGVKEMLRWGLCHGMHVLGDEVYVGSIFRPLAAPAGAASATGGPGEGSEQGGESSPARKGGFERGSHSPFSPPVAQSHLHPLPLCTCPYACLLAVLCFQSTS